MALICNVKQNDEASSFSQSFQHTYFALTVLLDSGRCCSTVLYIPSGDVRVEYIGCESLLAYVLAVYGATGPYRERCGRVCH